MDDKWMIKTFCNCKQIWTHCSSVVSYYVVKYYSFLKTEPAVWPNEYVIKSPKMWPNPFFVTIIQIYRGKQQPKNIATYIVKNLP
jgi:hypothetical protein